jgi:hypothetical protein
MNFSEVGDRLLRATNYPATTSEKDLELFFAKFGQIDGVQK